jgi:hypothetical protein
VRKAARLGVKSWANIGEIRTARLTLEFLWLVLAVGTAIWAAQHSTHTRDIQWLVAIWTRPEPGRRAVSQICHGQK